MSGITNNGRVPRLRFPEFRELGEWKQTPLGDCLDYQQPTPYLVAGTNYSPTFKTPVLTAGKTFILGYTDEQHGIYSEELPVIIFDDFTTATQFVDFPFKAKSSAMKILQSKNGTNIKFMYETLQTLSYEVAAHERHWISNFALMPVPVPTPAEQQKIADCLSSLDDLITLEAQKLDSLKAHKKGLMQQLFPREGETQPRLRFPEFQNAGEWSITTVGGVVKAGFLFPPKDGNHGNIHPKSSDYVAKGIPFIMASDINGGVIDIDNCHFISKDQADSLQKGFAKKGDVLLSHKGTVGEVAVVRKINTPYLMLTPQVTYYRVKDRMKLSNEFLAHLFVSDAFQSNLAEVSGGGTRAYIGITEQANLRLQLPRNVDEQQRIASCLTSLDDLITAQTQKLEALKTHKKGLMQQLFPQVSEE